LIACHLTFHFAFFLFIIVVVSKTHLPFVSSPRLPLQLYLESQ
jgi:hypothetical protein